MQTSNHKSDELIANIPAILTWTWIGLIVGVAAIWVLSSSLMKEVRMDTAKANGTASHAAAKVRYPIRYRSVRGAPRL
jgi:hypothetical protein